MKKFWLPTLQLIVSGVICSAVAGGAGYVREEIKFHVEVRERLTWIETALGKPNKKEETHVAVNN